MAWAGDWHSCHRTSDYDHRCTFPTSSLPVSFFPVHRTRACIHRLVLALASSSHRVLLSTFISPRVPPSPPPPSSYLTVPPLSLSLLPISSSSSWRPSSIPHVLPRPRLAAACFRSRSDIGPRDGVTSGGISGEWERRVGMGKAGVVLDLERVERLRFVRERWTLKRPSPEQGI